MSVNLLDLFKRKVKKEKSEPDNPQGLAQATGSKNVAPAPAYGELVEEIDRMVNEKEVCPLSKLENKNMVTYLCGKRKILNINKNSEPPRTYFLFSGADHQAKELAAQGLRPISKNEAKQKRYGPVKALYAGNDPKVIKSMLEKVK
ncbi:MAG: hypothetical protein FH756_13515 [Firmicutes bacterium]|nr:hypothetical protein [Bacillota bacterium]